MTNELDNYEVGWSKLKQYIEEARTDEGLLNDVKNVILGPRHKNRPEPPLIWILKGDIELANPRMYGTDFIKRNFDLWCIVYDPDLETAYDKSENLAIRTMRTLNNAFKKDTEPFFERLDFVRISPAEVEITEGSRNMYQCVCTFEGIFKENDMSSKSPVFDGVKNINGDIRLWQKKKEKKESPKKNNSMKKLNL